MIQTETASNETKQKIIDAAKTLFSQKGFDGASIRDIAECAEVNKSLVHYYFKSKSHILEVLAREFLDNTLKHIAAITDKYRTGIINRKKVLDNFIIEIFDYLFQEKQLIGILINEAILPGNEEDFIFDLITIIQDWMLDTTKAFRFSEIGNVQDFRSERFYFTIVPILIYIIMEDKMVRFEKITIEQSRKRFIGMLKKKIIQNQLG